MALPIALAAIVAVGALIAGVFFASTQEYRVGRNTLATQRAMQAAEVGLNSIVSSWTTARTNAQRVGTTASMTDTTIDGVSVKRQYTRVSPTTFWVTAKATLGGGALEGRSVKILNSIIRIETPDFKIMGAITSRGTTSIAGSTTISGNDTTPKGWDCPPAAVGQSAGIVANAATTTGTGTNCTGFACVTGTPKVLDSASMVADTMNFTKFGGMNYDSLTKLATKIKTDASVALQPNPRYLADGVTCDVNHADNWGDTSHVDTATGCDGYYPVVHLKGPTATWNLNGIAGGQGIILVDGNVVINGKFKWTGLILIRGYVTVNGTGGGDGTKIIGAIAAMNRGAGGINTFTGNSSVAFSRCAVEQVTSRLSTAAPLRQRAWADLSY
jgi:hypothetical protein